ncbi:MAG: hypothetical protein ACOCV1_03100 [Bacillota bacterium]
MIKKLLRIIKCFKNYNSIKILIAIIRDPFVIEIFADCCIPELAQLIAVNRSGYLIRYISNPSEEVQLDAISQNSNSIFWISDPTEKVQLTLVKKDPKFVIYIEHPTRSVQEYIILNHPEYINYISFIHKELKQKYDYILSGDDLEI